MKNVELLLGCEDVERTPLRAYSDEAISFITDFSSTVMKSPVSRMYPDLAALAFWGRRGNLLKMKESCEDAEYRLGRGVCFHIAPSNIPINFAFTYMFGLLSGCSNIVRLPSAMFPQTDAAMELIKLVVNSHPEVKKRSCFVRYPADNDITGEFSAIADARMIWGGDQTVQSIRKLATQPKCIDICFADRYSLCVINGDSIVSADDSKMYRLAEDFYNDTYLMDQNACSSPKIICWVDDSIQARRRFWDAVFEVASKKYELQAAVSVDKYMHSCEDSIDHADNIKAIKKTTNLLYNVEINQLLPGMDCYRGFGGYFYECALDSIDEIAPIVTEKYQTVTYFGVDPEQIRTMVLQKQLRGIDRIAPIGKAMDIGVKWDGYDLVRMLSRIVNVE